MKIEQYSSIKDKHSFHIDLTTRYWAEYDSVDELKAILRDAASFGLPIMPIGGGCNLLFKEDYPGILLHSTMCDIRVIEENDEDVIIAVGSGKNWDELVDYTVEKAWGGLQNLSGIPGDVGAGPIQNIGAYGVEVKDAIWQVEVLDRTSLETKLLSLVDCELSYRNSRFKHDWKGQYVVTEVYYKLSKHPDYQLSYGALRERIASMGGLSDSVRDNLRMIRRIVLEIRNEKLPSPDRLGNAGSFFMNPVVEKAYYDQWQNVYPDMPAWKLDDGRIKLSAAWLIEQCGYKGKKVGNVGVYEKQALVLVNYGGAQGKELVDLFEEICAAVYQRFECRLSPEVIMI